VIISTQESKTRGNKMSKEQMEIEYLNAKVRNLEVKINIYNDQFGPTDEHVVKLKNEVKKLDMLILDLMIAVQENSVKQAIIE
jgi:hypothetical protein